MNKSRRLIGVFRSRKDVGERHFDELTKKPKKAPKLDMDLLSKSKDQDFDGCAISGPLSELSALES